MAVWCGIIRLPSITAISAIVATPTPPRRPHPSLCRGLERRYGMAGGEEGGRPGRRAAWRGRQRDNDNHNPTSGRWRWGGFTRPSRPPTSLQLYAASHYRQVAATRAYEEAALCCFWRRRYVIELTCVACVYVPEGVGKSGVRYRVGTACSGGVGLGGPSQGAVQARAAVGGRVGGVIVVPRHAL